MTRVVRKIILSFTAFAISLSANISVAGTIVESIKSAQKSKTMIDISESYQEKTNTIRSEKSPTLLAQWGNWGNWGNWQNWNNWNNFNKVPQWANGWNNFLNY